MNSKEIHELIKLVNETDISEVRLKDKDFSLVVRSNDFFKNNAKQIIASPQSMPVHTPTASSETPKISSKAENTSESETAPVENSTITINSPMVGTFYRKPSPDKDVFVKVGDKIEEGSILCIIEAMKLFNEIESEVSGTIIKILVDDQVPVEYNQPLFIIDPS